MLITQKLINFPLKNIQFPNLAKLLGKTWFSKKGGNDFSWKYTPQNIIQNIEIL